MFLLSMVKFLILNIDIIVLFCSVLFISLEVCYVGGLN